MIKMSCVMTSVLVKQVLIRPFSMKPQAFQFFTALTLLFSSLTAFSQLAVPPLANKRIHDEAHILSPHTVEQLEVQLRQYEDSTSNQIAILIIPSLEGDAIEEYSLRVAHDKWKLGQGKNDNGVLLL